MHIHFITYVLPTNFIENTTMYLFTFSFAVQQTHKNLITVRSKQYLVDTDKQQIFANEILLSIQFKCEIKWAHLKSKYLVRKAMSHETCSF